MNDNFNEAFEKMKNVPTGAMSDITSEEMGNIGEHTKVQDFSFTQAPQGGGGQQATQPQQPIGGQPSQSLNVGNLVNAKMAMQLANILIPTLLSLAIKQFAKKQVNKKSLEANREEREIIEPVLQSYLQSISFNVEKPINALILTIAMVYGTKVVEVINEAPTVQRPLKREPTAEVVHYVPGVNANGTKKKDGRGRPRKK